MFLPILSFRIVKFTRKQRSNVAFHLILGILFVTVIVWISFAEAIDEWAMLVSIKSNIANNNI